jgi:large subunit ribosomal protein L15
MANLNTIQRRGQTEKTRVGRGGKRGKTSGRGTKGQSARAGNKKRPEFRDIIKKLPKRRGYGKNRGRTVDGTRPDPVAIEISRLDAYFDAGTEINPKAFFSKGIVKGRGLKFPMIKIVSGGEITKKFSFAGVGVSKGALAAIKKVGGTVALLPVKKVKRVHTQPSQKSAVKADGKTSKKTDKKSDKNSKKSK